MKDKAERKRNAKTSEPSRTLPDPYQLIGRLASELCYSYSVLQSHNAKLIKILEDKGLLSKSELEPYADQFGVERWDTFHLRFLEKKLKDLGFPPDTIRRVLKDIKALAGGRSPE